VIKFSVKVDASKATALFGSKLPRALPYVASRTLNVLAAMAQKETRRQMPVVFDRPTDYALKAVQTRVSNRQNLESSIQFPQSAPNSGKGKHEFIRPGAMGAGARAQRRHEKLLSRTGWLPPGWVTVPGRGASLDRHGNIPGVVYKQMINVLQIRGDSKPIAARSQKAATRLGVDRIFFAVSPGANKLAKGGGWLPPGVYRRTARGVTQMLKFVRKASYVKRLDLKQIGLKEVQRVAPEVWAQSVRVLGVKFARN
jgi:hypothetical protein